MSLFPELIGPTYTAASPIADCERCVNWMPERVTGQATGQNQVWYRPTPGTTPFVTLRDSPVRALYNLNGRCFAVAGGNFFEILSNGSSRQWGTVANSVEPATMCSNGDGGLQLFIVSGGSGYIFDLSTLSSPSVTLIDPNTTGFPSIAVMGGFVDGYFVVLEAHSGIFFYSDLEDGSVWEALNVAEVSESSNRIVSLLVDHRIVRLFGQQTTEGWYNSGYGNTPFQPDQTQFMESGIIAPWSAVKVASQVFYLGGSERGAGSVYQLANPPTIVSTPAIDAVWKTYGQISNAIGWAYETQTHAFYALWFPTGPRLGDHTTWFYDLQTGMWHERGLWDEVRSVFVPAVGRCHTYCFGKHLVGDRSSGTIYVQDEGIYSDQVTTAIQP